MHEVGGVYSQRMYSWLHACWSVSWVAVRVKSALFLWFFECDFLSQRRPTNRRHLVFPRTARLVGPTDRSPAGVTACPPLTRRWGRLPQIRRRPQQHPNPLSKGKRAGEHRRHGGWHGATNSIAVGGHGNSQRATWPVTYLLRDRLGCRQPRFWFIGHNLLYLSLLLHRTRRPPGLHRGFG